jgi:hypothetical protein
MQVRCRAVILKSNRHYEMTRLGFGINIAPKVLKTILLKILPENLVKPENIYVDFFLESQKIFGQQEAVQVFKESVRC